MKNESGGTRRKQLKLVCTNGHILAKLPKGDSCDSDGVIEIKCRRCRHFVYLLIDHVHGRIKVRNGSMES